MASKLTKTTTDHEEIRRWAEEREAHPAEVARTERGGETGVIRLDFPGYSGAGSLKPISWEQWFEKFDGSGLALVYQERTARGELSNFNKLVARETARARASGRRGTGSSTRRTSGKGTREAPRAVAARLSGRGRTSGGKPATSGTRRKPAKPSKGSTPSGARRSGTRTSRRASGRGRRR